MAQGRKVLNRYNCTGCHVLEMPKFTIPAGVKVAEAFTDFKANLRSSYTSRANDYLAELYPGLTYDPKKKLDADEIESELGLTDDDGHLDHHRGDADRPVRERADVQLWQPVTIRGYTFNVGDNVTLDQTKIQKTPAVGRRLRLALRDLPGGTDGHAVRVVLEPAAAAPAPRGEQGPDALADLVPEGSVRDPPGGPVADAAVPLRQVGADRRPTRPRSWPTTSPRAIGPSSPTRRSPSGARATSPSARRPIPNYLAAGWQMMTNKASPCLQCHAIGQFKPTGGDQVVNGPDLRQVATRFRPDYLEAWLANPRRLVPFTAMPQNIAPHGAIQIPVPKTFENQPIEMVQAIRDTLLNYVNAVELQLAGGGGPKTADAPAAASGVKTSSATP